MALTKKLMGAVVAIALVLTTILTFAFKAGDSKNHKKQEATIWHYTNNSTTAGAFANASNWAQGAGSGCGPSGNKPCEITVDAADESELDTYLSGLSNPQVLAINPSSKRN